MQISFDVNILADFTCLYSVLDKAFDMLSFKI